MNMSSEQSVGRAIEAAASRIALPPRSRWIPEERQRSGAFSTAAVVLGGLVLVILVGVQLAFMREQGTRVGGQPNAFQLADDAEWARIRTSLPPDVLVLRPTWIPVAFSEVGTSDCPTPLGIAIVSDRGYDFNYRMGKLINPANANSCAKIQIRRNAYQVSPQLADAGVLDERGTVVGVRLGPQVVDSAGNPHQLIYLNWVEDGTQFELSTLDVGMRDTLRVLRGLAPMR